MIPGPVPERPPMIVLMPARGIQPDDGCPDGTSREP
jgi:hypothetical protein